MQVQILDRATGNELQAVSLEEAAKRIALVLEIDEGEVVDGLMAGISYRTVGCHYQLKQTPPSDKP